MAGSGIVSVDSGVMRKGVADFRGIAQKGHIPL
jgi:hypothetical protein